jgi:hypothetical protein
MDRGSLMTARRVADVIGDGSWREISLRLVDALRASIRDRAKRPSLGERTEASP